MALDPRLDAEQVLAAVACDWLRPLQPEDRAFHHALYADPDNMRWLGGAIAPTAADAAFAAALAQLRRPAGAAPAWRFAGCRDGRPAALFAAEPRVDAVTIGAIVAPAARGDGLARRGLAGLRDGFAHLGASRIAIVAMAANGPMLGLAASLGFRAVAASPRAGWLTLEWSPAPHADRQELPR